MSNCRPRIAKRLRAIGIDQLKPLPGHPQCYNCLMETEFEVQCPYCGESIWIEFYPEDGASQETIMDCGVCCVPISFKVKFDHEGRTEVLVERSN